MPAPRILALVAFLLALPPGARAMEKCVSPEGKISYSDEPCPAGSKSRTISAPPPRSAPTEPAKPGAVAKAGAPAKAGGAAAAAAASAAKPAIAYFDVQGADFETLRAALDAHGGMHGQADWKLGYQYEPKRAGRVCSVGSLSTQLMLTMTLPKWAPPRNAPSNLVSRWTRYVNALRLHAEGHLQIGRDFETAFKRSAAVASTRTCDELEKTLKGYFDLLLAKYKTQDRDYDRDTAQGRTQGAEFK